MIEFIKNNWKDIIPISMTILGMIYGNFKWILTYRQRKTLENLELINKFFSKDALEKLNKESKFIQNLTYNAIPYFRGIKRQDVNKLMKLDLQYSNYYFLFPFYRDGLLNLNAKTTDKAKKMLKFRRIKKCFWGSIFFLWILSMAILLGIYSLPMNLGGWLIILITVIPPEIYLLNYFYKLDALKKFETN